MFRVVFCVFNLINIGCLWELFSVESSLFCCTEAVELFVILLACHWACTILGIRLLNYNSCYDSVFSV